MRKIVRKTAEKFIAWVPYLEMPLRLTILMALWVIVVESLEMTLALSLHPRSSFFSESIESVGHLLALFPLLYYLIYRPLKKSERQLRHLSGQLLVAQESERKRISRELHDELGQALSLLKLRLRSVAEELPEDQREAREGCNAILAHINTVIEDVRRLSRDLSPSILEDLGLTAALQRLMKNFKEGHGIEVNSELVNIDHLFSQEAAIVLYRILQEALTNIGKHADASNVSIAVREQDSSVSVFVEDDGKGFDAAQTVSRKSEEQGLGLAIMRERAQMLGGSVAVQSKGGKGTRISVTIPLEKGRRRKWTPIV